MFAQPVRKPKHFVLVDIQVIPGVHAPSRRAEPGDAKLGAVACGQLHHVVELGKTQPGEHRVDADLDVAFLEMSQGLDHVLVTSLAANASLASGVAPSRLTWM